jgi:hypothetical protein
MTKGKFILLAAIIAAPSTANAWSWWSGWESYAECTDYYTKNPVTVQSFYGYKSPYAKIRPYENTTHSYEERTGAIRPEEACEEIKFAEQRKQQAQAETNRILILGCRAESVTEAQFEACVALVIRERH